MRKAGLWAAIIILFFLGAIMWESLKLDYKGPLGFGPGYLPLWLSLFMAVLTIIYLISEWKNSISVSELFPKGPALREFLSIIVSMVLFVSLVDFAGFIIAGTLSLLIVLYRYFTRLQSLAISCSISIVIFMIFAKALSIPLPVNVWGW